MMAILLLSVVVGALLGGWAICVWRSLAARLGPFAFWPAFVPLAQSVVSGGEPAEFVRHYGQLLQLLARYLGRNALLAGASCLPIVLCTALLGPVVNDYYDRLAPDRVSWSPLLTNPELGFYGALSAAALAWVLVAPRR